MKTFQEVEFLAASRFVEFVIRHLQLWDFIPQTKDDKSILQYILTIAGFESPKVMVERPQTLMVVRGESRKPDTFALGWLYCAHQRAVIGITERSESFEQIVSVIAQEIERSIPLLPIRLTEAGDELVECPPKRLGNDHKFPYFVEHVKDTDKLANPLGIHRGCGGHIVSSGATETCESLSCDKCKKPFYTELCLETYNGLRRWSEFAVANE